MIKDFQKFSSGIINITQALYKECLDLSRRQTRDTKTKTPRPHKHHPRPKWRDLYFAVHSSITLLARPQTLRSRIIRIKRSHTDLRGPGVPAAGPLPRRKRTRTHSVDDQNSVAYAAPPGWLSHATAMVRRDAAHAKANKNDFKATQSESTLQTMRGTAHTARPPRTSHRTSGLSIHSYRAHHDCHHHLRHPQHDSRRYCNHAGTNHWLGNLVCAPNRVDGILHGLFMQLCILIFTDRLISSRVIYAAETREDARGPKHDSDTSVSETSKFQPTLATPSVASISLRDLTSCSAQNFADSHCSAHTYLGPTWARASHGLSPPSKQYRLPLNPQRTCAEPAWTHAIQRAVSYTNDAIHVKSSAADSEHTPHPFSHT